MRTLIWTQHARAKMRYYGLSEARVRRALHTPFRVEEGIAEGTVAAVQRAGTNKHPYELWVMVQDEKEKRKIISAWKYPGITKPGEALPIEIIREFEGARL